jgi:hypothetical protein
MLELKTKKELAEEAFKLAQSYSLVRHKSVTYIPADFETRETSVPPDIDRTIWLPLNRDKIRILAAAQFDTLFSSDSELSGFNFMVAQTANQVDKKISTLLVRTPEGLKELTENGQLEDPTREFRPNTLVPMLNTDQVEKARVFAVISGWLNSDVEAESMLAHFATCLSPGYSAVKYILLLGEGRNGKSVMLKMLSGLFGPDNVSNVTRLAMSERSPVVCELNGKLLNIIYDGQSDYLKDSATEKSLVAGEPAPIRRLYESESTVVQTNALFIEGLNREPKTHDKSMAQQRRLVRFQFPNVYDLNHTFERSMLTEAALGALLALLVDRVVLENEVAVRLAPTAKAMALQLEQMYANAIGLQFLRFVEETDPLGISSILGVTMAEVVGRFQSWRIKENDLGTWSDPEVQAQFTPLLNTERRSRRVNGVPRKVKIVTSLRFEATAFIDSLKGVEDDAALIETLVEDG